MMNCNCGYKYFPWGSFFDNSNHKKKYPEVRANKCGTHSYHRAKRLESLARSKPANHTIILLSLLAPQARITN